MKKRMVSIILSSLIVLILLTGCRRSGNTGTANSAETVDGTESTEEKDASEENTVETQEGAAEEAVTETADTTIEEKRYRVKTFKEYKLTEDGEKTLTTQGEYKYDNKGNEVWSKRTFLESGDSEEFQYEYDEYGNKVYSKTIDGEYIAEYYYENELDEDGRALKITTLNGEKNPIGQVQEYSYIDDHFERTIYSKGIICNYAEGFISDGIERSTLWIAYDEEHPKTEDEDSYSYKNVYEYEGIYQVRSERYENNSLIKTSSSEFEEIDENNNPLVVHTYYKDYENGTASEYIVEYTYTEIE